MITTVGQVLTESKIMNALDGHKGTTFHVSEKKQKALGLAKPSIRFATSNSAIKNNQLDKSLDINTVKQLNQYDNKKFNELLKIGYKIKYKHFTLLFKETETKKLGKIVTINILNTKTNQSNNYLVESLKDLNIVKESDRLSIPILEKIYNIIYTDIIYNTDDKEITKIYLKSLDKEIKFK